MRAAQIRRHLGAPGPVEQALAPMFKSGAPGPAECGPLLNLEFSPRDYVAYLLSIDAEIEHCLMVQYLYAGYSLGGAQVPESCRDAVRNWQEVILGVAKEEMGHLITVQNSLRLIGAPLHLEREDTPWDVPFYPFPFMLEPLTLDSLAKYVYAEAPIGWEGGAIGAEIRRRVHAQTDAPHHVAELFHDLLCRLAELPDSAFDASTCPAQADFAEWGRGYQGGQRGHSSGQPRQTPDVIVQPQTCRDDMVAALKAIMDQGEASYNNERSHFVRFLIIYVEMRELVARQATSDAEWKAACPAAFDQGVWSRLQPAGKAALLEGVSGAWNPARKVAVNPYVSLTAQADTELARSGATRISDPQSMLWATLFNVRYRMLLSYLTHSFTLYGGLTTDGAITPRGAIVNATFGEMYNLRALSEILMQSPASSSDPDAGFAGPPFQMPYTLDSPLGEANRWRGHLDLLEAAHTLVGKLLALAPPARHTYLHSMREADHKMRVLADRILSGSVDTALL